MNRSVPPIFIGCAWVVGSLIVWGVVCNGVAAVLAYLVNERQVNLPTWSNDVYNCAAFGGVVVIPAITALLAIRAYLPGTGRRRSTRRGFEVDPPQRKPWRQDPSSG